MFAFYLSYFVFCSFIYNASHIHDIPTNTLVEDFSFACAGVVGVSAALIRERTWVVMNVINTKNRDNSMKNRVQSNRLYMIMVIVSVASEIGAFMIIPSFLYEFGQSGKVHFMNCFYDFEPFSLPSYLLHFSHMICIWWISTYCAFYVLMVVEMVLRLAFFFRKCGEEVRNLRQTESFEEGREYKKLQSLIKDYNLFHWCIKEINETMRFYMMLYISLLFFTLGVYLAILLSVDSFREILSSLFFPIYLFSFLCVFCYLGQIFSDSVR